jgi:hypothetical protein
VSLLSEFLHFAARDDKGFLVIERVPVVEVYHFLLAPTKSL